MILSQTRSAHVAKAGLLLLSALSLAGGILALDATVNADPQGWITWVLGGSVLLLLCMTSVFSGIEGTLAGKPDFRSSAGLLLAALILAVPLHFNASRSYTQQQMVLATLGALPGTLPYTATGSRGQQYSGTLSRRDFICGSVGALLGSAQPTRYAVDLPGPAGTVGTGTTEILASLKVSLAAANTMTALPAWTWTWLHHTNDCPDVVQYGVPAYVTLKAGQ